MTRRQFLASSVAAGVASAAAKAQIKVGITSNTRPEWEGSEGFERSLVECSELGYHWIETFWSYLTQWEKRPADLQEKMAKLDLRMETVSNSGPLNMRFQDPAAREEVIADHMRLVRFIKALGCDHLKINCGAPNPGGNTEEIYREQAKTFDELGRRIADEGLKFGIHAHLWSQFETPRDVERVMELTRPEHVGFILDTGHTTMAGMDPMALTKAYGQRILEYHLKDVAPKDRGGYKGPPLDRTAVNTGPDDLIFFPLGKGGVDFPGILAHLDGIGWKGWFTVELDRADTTAKDSAARSKRYIEKTLGLTV
jgi:inosose dehydratase